MSLVQYQRSGGRSPANAERLDIEEDGAFRLLRAVSAGRAGSFAGTLPPQTLTALKKRIAEASGTPLKLERSQPSQVVERVVIAEASSSFSRDQKLPPKFAAVVRQLRELCESLLERPSNAIELSLEGDGSGGKLSKLGPGSLNIDFSRASLGFSLFAEDEQSLQSGRVELPADVSSMKALPAEWQCAFAMPDGLEFNPKRTLQLRFNLKMKFDDGISRDAQISAVAGKGW
jgi:hypothetical protein